MTHRVFALKKIGENCKWFNLIYEKSLLDSIKRDLHEAGEWIHITDGSHFLKSEIISRNFVLRSFEQYSDAKNLRIFSNESAKRLCAIILSETGLLGKK